MNINALYASESQNQAIRIADMATPHIERAIAKIERQCQQIGMPVRTWPGYIDLVEHLEFRTQEVLDAAEKLGNVK